MAPNMGGTNQHIHCSVNNCHYWDSQNVCVASEIMVTSDDIGANKPDTYDHQMAVKAPPTPVDACMSTCCKTFVEKGSSAIQADKVTRLK
jgi:hypothetical protein